MVKEEEELSDEFEKDDTYAIIPPNGGYGWLVVACAFYCNVVVDGIQLTFGVFLEEISKNLETDYSQIALAGSLMFGTHLLMGPLCAGFSTEFGLRPVTIAGSIICCCGVGLTYFATAGWYLYLTYGILGGVGLGLIYMNTLIITGIYFTTMMPVAMSIVLCGTGVGTMVFAALGHFLLVKTNWRISFLIQAGLAGSMGIAAMAFKPLKPIQVRFSSGVSTPKSQSAKVSHSKTAQGKGTVFIKREIPTQGSVSSLRTLQSLVWDAYLEDTVVTELKRKPLCSSKCCKICKKAPKPPKNKVLVLSAVKSDKQGRRRSYRESVESDDDSPSISYAGSSNQHVFEKIEFENKKVKFCESLRRTLVNTADCRLLGSCAFFLFTLSGALQMACLLIVYIYEKDRSRSLGFTEEMSVYFVICLGAANMLWRLILGGLALIPKIRHDLLAVSGIVTGGIATLCSGLSENIYYQFGYCILFGLGMASYAVFRLILLLELVELRRVENATGINLLFMGVACIIFPPLFGWAMEARHDFNVIFFTAGSLLCISGLMLLGLKKLRQKELRRKSHS